MERKLEITGLLYVFVFFCFLDSIFSILFLYKEQNLLFFFQKSFLLTKKSFILWKKIILLFFYSISFFLVERIFFNTKIEKFKTFFLFLLVFLILKLTLETLTKIFFIDFSFCYISIMFVLKITSFHIYFTDKKKHNPELKNFLFFLLIPELVYKKNYKRTQERRFLFLLERVFEIVFLSVIFYTNINHNILSLTKECLSLFQKKEFLNLFHTWQKLSLRIFIVWFVGFYLFFHSVLNIIAELFLIENRCFYEDWWNSKTVIEYWRKWNIPVHIWFKTHVYFNLQAKGYSKKFSHFFVFFLSAALHELLTAAATGFLSGILFFLMFVQSPLFLLIRKDSGKRIIGNILLWIGSVFFVMPSILFLHLKHLL